MKTNTELAKIIDTMPARSAWSRGVKSYAIELIETASENDIALSFAPDLKKALLNGAADWSAYSSGGCALIYDADICERLCSPSERRKTRDGERQPNRNETWLDCQARALHQAERIIARAVKA